jgi:hypothetical protein
VAVGSFTFSTPGFVQDFPTNPTLQTEMNDRWNTNLTGWVQQAMPAPPTWFYNPAVTPVPAGTAATPVLWNAFPGRLQQFYSSQPPVTPPNPYNLSANDVYSLADYGSYRGGGDAGPTPLPDIPTDLCPGAKWHGPLKTFGPYGPRGWLDEYCEWAVARDANDNIMRVDFTCENPEYWATLWKVSPKRVVELYNSTLNFNATATPTVSVALSDLQLTDTRGQPIIDPDTGRPAYNPLNKWNTGPVSLRVASVQQCSGGAMHLTSTPNTLQTEIGLAGGATPQYTSGNLDSQSLICCGKFGQEYRHSDPHIGQSVSQAVNPHSGTYYLVNLADPFGLYIQMPNFINWTFGPNIVPGKNGIPANAKPSDVWQIARGSQTVVDPVTGQPFNGNMILHAVCQIPKSWLTANPSLTLADIYINGKPIMWAGQIADTFNMALYARAIAAGTNQPPTVACPSSATAALVPLQCMYTVLWNGYYSIIEGAPTGAQLSLASNTTFVAPQVPANGQAVQLTLICTTMQQGMSVGFLLTSGSGIDPAIAVAITGTAPVTYAVPGNSYPDNYFALSLNVTVAKGAATGLRGVQISQGGTANILPAAIDIV